MPKTFRPYAPDQMLLLPSSVQDWVPEGVIAFYGAKDARVNAGIPGFAEAMSRVGMPFEWHVYEGAGHGFCNDAAAAYYDMRASRDAFARLLMFLLEWLPGPPRA
jgi:dienelactone hydrolase